VLLFFCPQGYRSQEPKIKLKVEQILERLHFILGGCVDKGMQDSDRIMALNQNGKSLKEQGALAAVISGGGRLYFE